MTPNKLEFYETEEVVSEEFQKEFDEEAGNAPHSTSELAERLIENTSTSPADSGGDIDANWEDAEGSGDETVFGHSPTPDQSDVEANAHAMGIDFEDDEPLDLIEKMEKRDRDRFELDEDSKTDSDTI